MKEEPTCGQGLAAHSTLPSTVGEVMELMATLLDQHQRAPIDAMLQATPDPSSVRT